MSTTRYYDASIDDAERVAVVISEYDDQDRYDEGTELSPDELPDDFESWQVYTQFATGSAVVRILSANGD